MGIEFLSSYGAQRVNDYPPQPPLLNLEMGETTAPDNTTIKLDYELAMDKWQPIPTPKVFNPDNWEYTPRRFVDGKDSGRVIAWIRTQQNYVIPVRLSQIGAIVMRRVNDELRRESNPLTERIVTFVADLFAWDEVESFAIALRQYDFRLVVCPHPSQETLLDFELMRQATEDCSREAMLQLEKMVLLRHSDEPTLVDGRLAQKAGAFDANNSPIVGVVKRQHYNYLHSKGLETYFDLKPGERTPAFWIQHRYGQDVISWFLRLSGVQSDTPNWGIVRVEVPRLYFENHQHGNPAYLDRLSKVIWHYRCRDSTYNRAPVSLHPIQRAEESLGSCFVSGDMLNSRFYRFTKL